jgi:hypothetical protein
MKTLEFFSFFNEMVDEKCPTSFASLANPRQSSIKERTPVQRLFRVKKIVSACPIRCGIAIFTYQHFTHIYVDDLLFWVPRFCFGLNSIRRTQRNERVISRCAFRIPTIEQRVKNVEKQPELPKSLLMDRTHNFSSCVSTSIQKRQK